MSNNFTKDYADGQALTETDLDTGFQTVQPSRANLALSTTGSTAAHILQSQGSNVTPEWVSLNEAINDTTMSATAANRILNAANSSTTPTAGLFSKLGVNSPGTFNIGVRLSAGTFTICGSNGSDLSVTNPGYVIMGSQVTPGRLVILTLTANQSFNDDAFSGTSDIAGEEFGTKAGTAWSNDRPFFLYAVNRDDTAANFLFGLSPCPSFELSPSNTNFIGYKSTPSVTPSDSSLWLFGSSLTPANYTSRPVLRIGGIRMRKAVTTDDWTVQALSTLDGIKPSNYENTTFNFSAGECAGTQASSFFINATPPTWINGNSSLVAIYYVRMNGEISFIFDTTPGGNITNGTGTAQLILGTPYRARGNGGVGSPYHGHALGFLRNVDGTTRTNSTYVEPDLNQAVICEALPSATAVAHNSFTGGVSGDVRINYLTYRAFG
jgi:hypothetical protein